MTTRYVVVDDYREYIIETYRASGEPSHHEVRARPCAGQGVSTSLKVRCSSSMRELHPIGTTFKVRAKLTDREGGGEFLHAPYDWPYVVVSNREAQDFVRRNFPKKRAAPKVGAGRMKRARTKPNYIKAEIQFWWNERERCIKVTAADPPKDTKLATTFPASVTSERWHRSMFTWLAKMLDAEGKPAPQIPEQPARKKQDGPRKRRVSREKRRARA